MYKLINPNGTIHDFAHRMGWGHNIEDFGRKVHKFDELETQEFNWTVFHFFNISRGDFIIRNMQSGKIGLYEIISSKRSSEVHDMFDVVAIFCGYYNKDSKTINIFPGYGIKTIKSNSLYYAFINLFRGKEK